MKYDVTLVDLLKEKAVLHPREGFCKCYMRLRNEGIAANHKRALRVYKQLRLSLRRKVKKRLPKRTKQKLEQAPHIDHTWSIDFMSDVLENGRKFRCFNIMDDYNREALHIEIDYSIKSSKVIWILNHLLHRREKPRKISMDNGPEFIAELASQWNRMHNKNFNTFSRVNLQNAYIERFNRTYREQVLDANIFEEINQVREITQAWIHDYNYKRPHEGLGGKTPMMLKYGKLPNAQAHLEFTTFQHQ